LLLDEAKQPFGAILVDVTVGRSVIVNVTPQIFANFSWICIKRQENGIARGGLYIASLFIRSLLLFGLKEDD